MAEFKLGRIRFVWQGPWTTGTSYIVDDVVNRGGKSYICVVNHTAAASFTTDISTIPSKWNLVADGTSWRGDWLPSTAYEAGDQVKNGGIVYICSTGHTSATYVTPTYLGLEYDFSKWTVFASSFNWTGEWAPNSRYKLNDLIKYSGITYICNLNHISSASTTLGLEPDLSKWSVFSDGISYVGMWTTSTRYKLNDVVKYGADLWICTLFHTSSTFIDDSSNWSIFVAGIQFENSWNNGTTYQVGDIVTYGGYTYVAKTVHENKAPIANPNDWDVFTTGFNFRSDWDSTTAYKIGDVVRLHGYTYVALFDSTNDLPPSIVWSKLNSGISWTNNAQTYTSVSGTNVTGSGTGAQFNIVRSKTVYTITVTSGYAGTSYVTGNTIKILGSAVGGLSPVNDILITVTATSGEITDITWTGKSVTWTLGISYSLGDVVTFGANSYICSLTHTAVPSNRPDNDTSGTNWNALALGSDVNALTTQGDMLYYGQTGPTRLPVGIEGQILRVTNGYPTWSNYGLINNLVYVGPLGSDVAAPQAGLTIDKPWKSVRFACHQIEHGYQNPNAKSLILRNKQFIIKEVNNFLSYTYKVSITGTSGGALTSPNTAMLSVNMPIRFANTTGNVSISTTYYVKQILSSTLFTISTAVGGTAFTASGSGTNTGTFYYDQTKAERDAGIIVEAVAHDLSRLGTQKTTAAALAYFNTAGTTYITTTTGYEVLQFTSAVNYLSTLLGNVLTNTIPTFNYQILNGASVTAAQITDLTITAETGVVSTAQNLVSIVTTGLTSGSAAAVPTAIVPNTTISVKTGTYTEILPIVLPANTAIVGDELRNTVIQPALANPNIATSALKTQLALTRFKTVIPNLIANTTITPTSGNTTAQVTTLPAGSTGSLTAISNLKTSFDIVYGLVANGLGGESSIVRPLPTGYNTTLINVAYSASGNLTGNTTGYGDAITQIQQNYAFIAAEISAVIVGQGTVTSAFDAKGYRDTSYILDSLIYDLTYGGNSQSNIAGSSYYSLYVLSILSVDKTPFVTAITRLKTIISPIIQQTVLSTAQFIITQNVSGTAGSVNAGKFAEERLQNIINWINNGTSDTGVAPYTGWTSSELQTAYNALISQSSNIQSDAVSWCQKYFQSIPFSTTLAYRDAGLIINNLAYDMIFGTNFNAIQTGRLYNRATTREIALRSTNELKLTLGSINFMYYKAKQIAASGASVQLQTTIDDISNFLTGGASPPNITMPQPALPASSYTGVPGTVISGGGDGFAAFTINRITNTNGYYAYTVTPTSAGANYTTSSKIKILGTSIGGATPVNDIVLNVTRVTTGGVVAATYSDAIAAAGLIESNRQFVLAEIIAYIDTNYSSITTDSTYSVTKTQRDASYILDAIKFDLMYGGNWASQNAGMSYYSALYGTQITSGFTTAFVNTVGYISTLLQLIVIGNTVSSPLQVVIPQVVPPITQIVGALKDATQIAALTTIITNFITNGLTNGAPVVTVTTIATLDTFTSNGHGLNNGDIVIPQATSNGLVSTVIGYGTQYFVVSSNTNTFKLSASYNGAALTTFTNGTGLSIKLQKIVMPSLTWVNSTGIAAYTAVTSLISTYQTSVVTYLTTNFSALQYLSLYVSRDVNSVVIATLLDMLLGSNYAGIHTGRAYNRLQDYKVQGYEKTATIASLNYLETLLSSTLSSSVYSSQLSRIDTSIYLIIKMLEFGSGILPEINGTVTYNNNLGIIKGSEILRANIPFLTAEAVALYKTRFGGNVTTTTTGSNEITTSAAHNFVVNDPVVFSGVSTSGLVVNTTYYVLTVTSPTTFTVTAVAGYLNSNQGTVYPPVSVTSSSPTGFTVAYSFSPNKVITDLTYLLNGIVYDLQYTGNYKSLRYVELFKNEINGSQASNMLLVRNGTGLRNLTTSGLVGTLTNPNAYGTKRPTAGAYVSLDPGFGPNDSNSWIITRSPYVQNVTTFGTGCVGLKIDGALHNGGNRSVVANDYTQVLSDGIGVWCTGNNSLTELVSVFSYYGYSGYLAELGGRIRATNGNSSYGTWGVIAEGTDVTELPITCILDNHSQQAQISNVFTDGTNKVLRLEYSNAGSNYTNTVMTISGSGYNIAATADEFRDAAVFETRIIDLNDGNGYGGTNYGTAINAAQNGTSTYITIAATDIALSTAYTGMRIQLTAGSGVGQYGNILSYNNGTKIALVYKDSFTNLTVTATAITNNLLTVASTAKMYVGMPIYLNTTGNGLTANTLYYVIAANFSSTQFAVSTVLGGSAVTITATGSGLTVTLYAAGWDHVVAGTAIVSTLDLTTQYSIEPRISYTDPGYAATARTLSTTGTWGAATYGNSRYISIATATSNLTQYSNDGKTWAAGGTLPSSANWANVVYGGGQGATAYAVIGGLGGSGAILTAVLGSANSVGAPGADQVLSVTIVNGGVGYYTAPTIVFTPVSGGTGAIATCAVLNGSITSVTIISNGTAYAVAPTISAATDRVTKLVVTAWGTGYTSAPTVTLSGGGSSNQATGTAVLTNNGVSSITIGNNGGSGYTSTPTVSFVDPTAKYVTIASNVAAAAFLSASSTATTNWTASTTVPQAYADIAYGNGVYVAVGGTSGAASTTDAVTWVSRTIPTLGAGTYSAVAYGNGYFVAISTGNLVTAISTNGLSWSAGGSLLSNTTWTSVTYGNGRFVAVASGARVTAFSIDNGTTWTTSASLPPGGNAWSTIRYGQGVFFVIAQSSTSAATSPDGINWTLRTMPGTSTNWKGLAFGSISRNPLWVATSATSGTTAASIRTGAQTLGRMKALSGILSEIRIIEPGSGYPKGTVTASTITTNLITVDNTENLIDRQPVVFTETGASGLTAGVTYYVIGSTITSTQFKVSATAGSATAITLINSTLTGTYRAGPILTQTDPNKVITAALTVRTGDGALGNPSFSNRGTSNTTATAITLGDGYADLYQPSTYITVNNLFSVPQAGSNISFASIPNTWYKLVSVGNVLGNAGEYSATFQISPGLSVLLAPAYGDTITTTNKYSQVRLTGHDFLYIGTGNQSTTNFPYVIPTTADIAKQELASGGGRVFFTSTDQDGNFNVGNLFGVQQSTGTATLNASAFNLSGLQSLQLGSVSLGIGSAVITQFSTDPYFTANSDSILPTQRAIKSYITSQIGGGLSSLNVNTLTAGVVYIANNTISTTNGGQINVTAKMNFTGGIDGAPVALSFFMQR
jgi:hypothetical protein